MASKMVVASKTAPKDGMTTGKKVAIGAAAVGGVAGLVGLGIWFWKRRQAAAPGSGPDISSARGSGGGGTASPERSGGGNETMTATAQCPPGTRDDGTRCVPQQEDDEFERAWGKAGDLYDLFRTGGYTTPIMGDRGDAASRYTKDFDRTGKAGTDDHGAGTGDFGQIASGPDAELAEQHRRLSRQALAEWNF